MMRSLVMHLGALMGEVFEKLDLPTEHARVSVSGEDIDAQFQCNGALACAKPLKRNPREIAQAIVDMLGQTSDIFEDLSIGGPGFINITLKDSFIAEYLRGIMNDDDFGVAKIADEHTVILDYGGPNIAKPMHVGHLRSSIIGDALRRIYDFSGYKTISDVHMGDWGTPMGMILSELELMGHAGEVSMEMLADIYPKASGACKEDVARMEQARAATKKLQDGDAKYTRIWREFIDVSIAGMKQNFDALGVQFDEWKGESDAHPYIAEMVEDLQARGIAVQDAGAWIISVTQEGDKKEMPPFILLKSDGAVLYSTTDLATIVDRVKTHDPDKIVYVVDQRQGLHFEQLFRVARLSGIVSGRLDLDFAGFGTMNGTDGKPFKTRAGGVMRLEDLIAMAEDKALARLEEAALAQDMDMAERLQIARKVGLAALKFADLQNNRVSDYVFDLDRMTSFEGKTGPYLLYQAVRIQSLLRKADFEMDETADLVISDEDRDLAFLLCGFSDALANALKQNAPHFLCAYAYALAQAFSSFYGRCHILSEEDAQVRDSRLALCVQTHKQLVCVLGLLGIDVPERM